MTPTLFTEDGKPLRLTDRIGKGGEGEIYAVEGSDLLVKYYTLKDLQTRELKVRHMLTNQFAQRTPLIAFPRALVVDRSRRFAGFLMSKATDHKPLHELYAPAGRKVEFPQANFRFIALSALNMASAVGAAHSLGCVIGDINQSGILIAPKATVTLIDADSFQIAHGSRILPCVVGFPEYTPPELQGESLGTIVRTTNHDAFGLAVAIFQLLFMGRHPFSGRYSKGEMPLEKAISEYRFAYSLQRNVGMDLPPGVPSLRDYPPAIGNAFEAAFSQGGSQGRPSVKQWMALLDELVKGLKVCAVNKLHQYSNDATECPWCRMERQFSTLLFLPIFDLSGSAIAEPVLGDVLTIWRIIDAIKPPPVRPFPQFTGAPPDPSAKVAGIGTSRKVKKGAGWITIALAVVLAFNAPNIILGALVLGGIGFWLTLANTEGDAEVLQSYKAIQARLYQAEDDWKKHGDGLDFLGMKADLLKKKNLYDNLPNELKDRLEGYKSNRRNEQLKQFLDTHQIRRYKIPNIGPAKRATLLSYGIETAADITPNAVLRVPGFGPINSQPLLNWRRHMEARFQYNPSPTPADVAANNAIKAEILSKAQQLKSDLALGPGRLKQAVAASEARLAASRPVVEALVRQHAQCVADVKALGGLMPSVSRPNTAQRNPSTISPASGTRAPAGSPARCPQCQASMVIRTARRGRHRGRQFYGCTRYPSCTGTRPYP